MSSHTESPRRIGSQPCSVSKTRNLAILRTSPQKGRRHVTVRAHPGSVPAAFRSGPGETPASRRRGWTWVRSGLLWSWIWPIAGDTLAVSRSLPARILRFWRRSGRVPVAPLARFWRRQVRPRRQLIGLWRAPGGAPAGPGHRQVPFRSHPGGVPASLTLGPVLASAWRLPGGAPAPFRPGSGPVRSNVVSFWPCSGLCLAGSDPFWPRLAARLRSGRSMPSAP